MFTIMNASSPSIAVQQSPGSPPRRWWRRISGRAPIIAALAITGIVAHLALRWGSDASSTARDLPFWTSCSRRRRAARAALAVKVVRRQFGSDLLAGISIVAAVLLGEYLAGALVVLMLSGGEALEAFAVRRASSVLQALARRMPLIAHRRGSAEVAEVPFDDVASATS